MLRSLEKYLDIGGRILLVAFWLVILIYLWVYLFSWQSSLLVIYGNKYVKTVHIDINRVGHSPGLDWLESESTLILGQPPQIKEYLYQLFNLKTNETYWRSPSEIDFSKTSSVKWSLPHIIEKEGEATILRSSSDTDHPFVKLDFIGFTISLSRYDFNFPPFGGTPGWKMTKSYYGLMQLTAYEGNPRQEKVKLIRLLVGEQYLPKLNEIATWLPPGNFLVIDAYSYVHDSAIHLLGPFNATQATKSE